MIHLFCLFSFFNSVWGVAYLSRVAVGFLHGEGHVGQRRPLGRDVAQLRVLLAQKVERRPRLGRQPRAPAQTVQLVQN